MTGVQTCALPISFKMVGLPWNLLLSTAAKLSLTLYTVAKCSAGPGFSLRIYGILTRARLEPTDALFIYGLPLREECESDHELGYELMKRMAALMLSRLQATRRQLVRLCPVSEWTKGIGL